MTLRMFDDPILHTPCEPVSEKFPDTTAAIADMERVLHSHANGVGLAAPQAGHSLRIIMLRPVIDGPIQTFINPEIVSHGPRTKVESEGCLSFPKVSARVKRWTFIRLRWFDDTTHRTIEANFHGWHARIIQHEIDHLNGVSKVGDAWRMQQKRKLVTE